MSWMLHTPVVLVVAAALCAQSGWSAPALEPTLNSTAADSGVHLSVDGLTLHFSSFRSGNWEIYSATRPFVGGAWSLPVFESAVSDAVGTDDQPFLTADGLQLYLSSNRTGSNGGSPDIMVATRASSSSPWNAPTFVAELNSTGADSAPSLTADGLEVYLLTSGWGAPYAPQNAIFKATRASTSLPFSTPALVTELSNANTHRDAEIAPDGLSIVYTESFAGRLHVLCASRTNRSLPFGTPVEWLEFSAVGTLGVFSFTRSARGNDACLAASFATGGQEILSTKFEGLTHGGVAGNASTMTLAWRDSPSPGLTYAFGAALGNTGFTIGNRLVPLDPDFLLIGTFATSVAPWSTGFLGTLDASGEAQGTLANPGGLLNGFVVYVGAFTLDPAAPFGVRTIANSFAVEFQ